MAQASKPIHNVIIIGAGVGGLTTAALLARAGLQVTVLEAHIYPGGCAGTFFHQRYHFDAGATLAGGFYPGGPMDQVAQAVGLHSWPAHPATPAMAVHLPDGQSVVRWSDERRHAAHAAAFGAQASEFWRWQETTADALWSLALQNPPWPPQRFHEAAHLLPLGLRWLGERIAQAPGLFADSWRSVASHLQGQSPALRHFVDGQLLIAAQATSATANALYGAAALDLPRRGVVHLTGGMGAIAQALVQAVRSHGGQVLYRQEVRQIRLEGQRCVAVTTKRGDTLVADLVIANLPPWNIARLVGEQELPSLRALTDYPDDGWGAFMLYVGFDGTIVPQDFPLHHQMIVQEPLGEGNSVFLSLSPAWDRGRAPTGKRALTISTHTDLRPWWRLYETDRERYERRKQVYAQRILAAAERVLPGLEAAADLILPGTPVTFQRFTRRARGWVGGFPQTSLFRAWGPRIGPNLWMVGDSIFPGQSTAAVALGGMRVAAAILREYGAQRAEEIAPSALLPSGNEVV